MVISGAKLAIIFLSATLAHFLYILLLNSGNHPFGSLSISIGFAIAFYAALSTAFERRPSYNVVIISITLGIALFYTTVFHT